MKAINDYEMYIKLKKTIDDIAKNMSYCNNDDKGLLIAAREEAQLKLDRLIKTYNQDDKVSTSNNWVDFSS